MALHVQLQSFLELGRAQKCRHHIHHRGAFAVRDRIEYLFHFFRVLDGNNHWMRRLQRIETLCGTETTRGELLPHFVVRKQGIGTVVFHVGSKSFIQPQSIPPPHRDQIAKPLMRQFMRHHNRHALLLLGGCFQIINHEIDFSVGYQPPVLHSTHSKLGDANHIQLRQWVGYFEEVVIEVQSTHRHIQRELPLQAAPWRGIHTYHHSSLRLALHEVKLTDRPCQQVRTHLGRRVEHELLHHLCRSIGGWQMRARYFWHVGNGSEMRRNNQSNSECRLYARLIPARKRSAGIQRLKLGACHHFLLPISICIRRFVESSHIAIQDTTKLQGNLLAGSYGEFSIKHEFDSGQLEIVTNLFNFRCNSSFNVAGECCSLNKDLFCVHCDFRHTGLRNINNDVLITVEFEFLQIWTQLQRIVRRKNICRQYNSFTHFR
mmetsp:Transcript_29085/g.48883  ORF Transcript_29085/g.48883 Transcript_29085/m.48883 type:complete len:432 (-) Transcript_29085:29-1324(-)